MASSVISYLQKHGINPNPGFSREWTSDNCYNWEAIEKQLNAVRGLTKDGEDNGIISKVLGTCLEAACKERRETTHKMQDLQDDSETTEQLLSVKIEKLQKQLEEAQLKEQKLGEHDVNASPKTS